MTLSNNNSVTAAKWFLHGRKKLQDYIQEMQQSDSKTSYQDSNSCYIFYTHEGYDILIQLDKFCIDN